MSVFTPAEAVYLQSQILGRLATVGPDGQPHVVPVAFRYNPDLGTIDIGGHSFTKRKNSAMSAATRGWPSSSMTCRP